MALAPVDGGVTLDPRRIELNSRAHLDRIQPGSARQIPESSSTDVNGQKRERERPSPQGWRVHEEANRAAGDAWAGRRASAWAQFSGGNARRGSYEIDGGRPVQAPAPEAPRPADAAALAPAGESGWARLGAAFEAAANREEQLRDFGLTAGRGSMYGGSVGRPRL